jgi:hypothetical protein
MKAANKRLAKGQPNEGPYMGTYISEPLASSAPLVGQGEFGIATQTGTQKAVNRVNMGSMGR